MVHKPSNAPVQALGKESFNFARGEESTLLRKEGQLAQNARVNLLSQSDSQVCLEQVLRKQIWVLLNWLHFCLSR